MLLAASSFHKQELKGAIPKACVRMSGGSLKDLKVAMASVEAMSKQGGLEAKSG